MRKTAVITVLALLAITVAAAPVGAFTFDLGNNLGKLSDWGSFYRDNEPLPVGTFGVGVEDRTLARVTQLFEPNIETAQNQYYNGIDPELSVLVYDLEVIGLSVLRAPGAGDPGKYEVYLGSAGRYDEVYSGDRNGGRVDVWVDPANDLNPAGTGGYPADWATGASGGAGWSDYPFDAGEYDTFPTATDGTAVPFLSGTLVAPDPENPNVLITLTLDFLDGTGVASQAYIHLTHNYSGVELEAAYLGGLAEIAFFNNFKFYPNASIPYEPVFDRPNTGTIYWATSSQDPINFTAIPEPSSLALLLTGILGLGGAVARRKRA